MGFLTKLQTLVVTPLAATANLITSGLSKITGVQYTKTNAANEVKNNPIVRAGANIILGGGAAIGAVLTAPVIASAGGIGSVAKSAVTSLIPSTTKGKIVAAAVAPVIASAIIQNPAKAIQVPGQILNFQTNVGGLIANPSLSKAVEIVKENPVISSLVAVGGVAAIGGGIGLAANTLATYNNSQSTQANTAASSAPSDIQSYTSDPTKTIQIINQIPPVVASEKAAPGGSSTPKKKKKATKKKAKPKKKAKKTTRRSKKKKKKSIKRGKS